MNIVIEYLFCFPLFPFTLTNTFTFISLRMSTGYYESRDTLCHSASIGRIRLFLPFQYDFDDILEDIVNTLKATVILHKKLTRGPGAYIYR